MDIVKIIVFGIAGAISGYFIPYFSLVICEYKTCNKYRAYMVGEPYGTSLQNLFFCIVNAAVWSAAGLRAHPAAAFFLSVLFSISAAAALIDLKIRIIPNELVLAMLAAGLGFHLFDSGLSALPNAALCLLGMMVLFTAAAALVGFGKVGAGDVKLAGAMGFALGYPGILTALLFMGAALLVFIVVGLVSRKLTLRTMLPFAPFMMFGMAAELVLRLACPRFMFIT